MNKLNQSEINLLREVVQSSIEHLDYLANAQRRLNAVANPVPKEWKAKLKQYESQSDALKSLLSKLTLNPDKQ